jgi:hypothetical protein
MVLYAHTCHCRIARRTGALGDLSIQAAGTSPCTVSGAMLGARRWHLALLWRGDAAAVWAGVRVDH